MPLRQRFESLLLFDPNRSPSTANVWISHPSPSEEQALGKLFVVAHIGGTSRVNLDVINLIQEELRTAYYQSVDAKPERAFEQALQQTNRRLHSVITDGVGNWVESANILVAAAWRDEIIMSSVGLIHTYLLRRGRMHDLLGSSEPQSINPVRIFSHVVSGQLQADDQLLFCTPSLLDYFSLEKLRRTMADGSPTAAVHAWESTLLGVEQQSSFAAIIVQLLANETVITPVGRPVAQGTLVQSAPQVSMDHLIAKEQATERLLSPSVWPAIRDVVAQLTLAISRVVRRLILRKPPRRIVPNGAHHPALASSDRPSTLRRLGRILAIGWQRMIGALQALRVRRAGVPTAPPPVTMSPVLRRSWRISLNSIVRWFQHLQPRQQALAGIMVLAIFGIAVSILPRTKNDAPTKTAATDVSIDDYVAQARAALLYGGEETAQKNIDAAELLYNALPKRSVKDKATRSAARTAIDSVITQLAHETIIPNPTIIAQLAAVAPQTHPQQLYLVGTKLLTLDPSQNIVTTVTVGKDTPAEIVPNTLDTGAPLTGTVSGSSTLTFATDRKGFVELDVSKNSWKPLDSAWPTSTPTIQAIHAYQSRIYALNTATSSIVRFSRSASSLGTGTDWLKESAQLSTARSLVVDGSIYVLQPQGVVELFTNGRKGAFSLGNVHPALTDATRLWTSSGSTYLYLVDPSRNRVLVFTKAGKLVDQYTSPTWSNLADIAVNESTKTLYVLSGTTISSVSLLH